MKSIIFITCITILVVVVLYYVSNTSQSDVHYAVAKSSPRPSKGKAPTGNCPPGYGIKNGRCTRIFCSGGFVNGKCISNDAGSGASGGSIVNTCRPGYKRVNGKCQKNPSGSGSGGRGSGSGSGSGGVVNTCRPGYKRVNGKCQKSPSGGASGGQQQPVPQPYCSPPQVFIDGQCKMPYIPPKPVPIGTNPWDLTIQAAQNAQNLMSQQRPNSSQGSQPQCPSGYVFYNGGCTQWSPVTTVGLPNQNAAPPKPSAPSGLGMGPPGSIGDKSAANFASGLVLGLVRDAKNKGMTWTEVMGKYPAIAKLPRAAIDNLHRDFIDVPTVDHDAAGYPIKTGSASAQSSQGSGGSARSMFGGVL